MNAQTQPSPRRLVRFVRPLTLLHVGIAVLSLGALVAHAEPLPNASVVKVTLSEWKVQATPSQVAPGPVEFEVSNGGSIPHAFELEGRGVEKSTPQIQPGARATLELDLRTGSYEIYCPVGKGSHKMLGMTSHLLVGNPKHASATSDMEASMRMGDEREEEHGSGGKLMKVTGGGTVIQILPGPFPFADSARAVIQARPADQQADLTKKAHQGPYSNNVARIAGDISLVAIDRGASGDSVSGTATFTAQDGTRWKVVMDRVQTKDIPFNPRFGGVIMGLFYHGASGVHTPLVPTIQSSLALWAYAHLYRNDQLVTDDAMVHIMLLSRTRRTGDWALDCWDCSGRPIEELQLQVTPAPNSPAFDSPGGFLFVNWEQSSGERISL
jgi:hypothetical protein